MAKLTLEHIKGNTYYIPSPTNIGVYVESDGAILIDSGNDKEAGRQIYRLLEDQGWPLKLIINTHSNADHIGGNAYLQEKTRCKIAASQVEAAYISDPVLEPSFLYGGFPFRDLKNKFLMAKPSMVTSILSPAEKILETDLTAVPLPGHFFGMIGIITPDNVFFIADSLFPASVINKYHLFFLWDIRSHLETIDKLNSMQAYVLVPGHGDIIEDAASLVETNKRKIFEIMTAIREACSDPRSIEELLQMICRLYKISLDATQYVLVSSTIRSYLSYLYEEDILSCEFEDGKMLWVQK